MTTTIAPIPGYMFFNLNWPCHSLWLIAYGRSFSVWFLSLILKEPWSICCYHLPLKTSCRNVHASQRKGNQIEKETKWRKRPDGEWSQTEKGPANHNLSRHLHWGSNHMIVEAVHDPPTLSQFPIVHNPMERPVEEPPILACQIELWANKWYCCKPLSLEWFVTQH